MKWLTENRDLNMSALDRQRRITMAGPIDELKIKISVGTKDAYNFQKFLETVSEAVDYLKSLDSELYPVGKSIGNRLACYADLIEENTVYILNEGVVNPNIKWEAPNLDGESVKEAFVTIINETISRLSKEG